MVLGCICLLCVAVALAPEREVNLTRSAVSPKPVAALAPALADVGSWPRWHFLVQSAALAPPARVPFAGSRVFLDLSARGRTLRLVLRVLEWNSGRRLRLQLESDSSGTLPRLFRHYEWIIELSPLPDGKTRINSRLNVMTGNWKSRLVAFLGRPLREAMLRAVFYPDVLRLSQQ